GPAGDAGGTEDSPGRGGVGFPLPDEPRRGRPPLAGRGAEVRARSALRAITPTHGNGWASVTLPMTPLLRLTDVSKAFGGVRALRGVSFDLLPGEVHALIGENGAGKSTLIKLVTGAHQPDSGTLEVNGQVITDHDPLKARALGIAAIYQQPALFPDLTVAENIALALEPPGAWRWVRWSERRARARDLLDRIGARIGPDTEVRSLTMPEQQLIEIAKAIGANARAVIMDEPTASLSDREVENLFRVIGDLKARGVGVVYVSHRL